MAVVTACYDATPAVRGPADILPTGAGERSSRRPGPKAVNRELDASVVDSTVPMTIRLFDRADKRDPQHQRRWIVLVDGNNHQIDRIRCEAHTHGVKVDIIVDFRPRPVVICGRRPRIYTPRSRAGPVSSPAPPATCSNTTRPGSSPI